MLHKLSQLPFGQTTIRTTRISIPGMSEATPLMSIEMMILPPPSFSTGRKISITSETSITCTPMGSVTTTTTTITVMPLFPFDNGMDGFDSMDSYDPMGYGMPDQRDFKFAGMDGQRPMGEEPVHDWRVEPFEPMAPMSTRQHLLRQVLEKIRNLRMGS